MAKKPKKKENTYKKQPELVSYGSFLLPPVVPGPEIEDLCKKIDDFYSKYPKQHQKQKASDLIKGAFYAMRLECRSNTDWMSQAANSARDVLYPLFSERISSDNLLKLFKKYAINKSGKLDKKSKEFVYTFDTLDKIYKKLSDLTHHGTALKGFSKQEFASFSEADFENLMNDFTLLLEKSFRLQQIYIHTLVDIIVKKKTRTGALKKDLDFLLKLNPDTLQYFYFRADESWISWLWKNDFLDAIKVKPEDSNNYGYRTPEINYLVAMVSKVPVKVTAIILDKDTATNQSKFNPELIDQFLRMCDSLPAVQLVKVIPKIYAQKWVRLMSKFSHWGFEYEKIFKVLTDAGEYKSLLLLAATVLDVRTKDSVQKTNFRFSTDNPFYFNDLIYTKVFDYLSHAPDEYAEDILALTTRVMAQIVLLGEKSEKEDKFPLQDIYHLFDVDFFSLELGQGNHFSSRDDVRELAATLKISIDKLIGAKCNKEAKEMYKKYIKPLPQSRAMWRLRLYVLSLCPEIFKEELKDSFFKLFRAKNYSDIIAGTEYQNALKKGFSILEEKDQREYVKKVVTYFKKFADENSDQKWHMKYGSDILSSIADSLTGEEKNKIKETGFKLDPAHEPEPSRIGPTMASIVQPRGPISQEEFGEYSIEKIVGDLRTELSPEKLKQKYEREDDFHHPRNAEGVGNLLQADIPKRLDDYIKNAKFFFEKDVLDRHYTYSFLRGVEGAIKNNRGIATEIDWEEFINLCLSIKKYGEENPLKKDKKGDRDFFNGWLAGWSSVHSAMTDVIQVLLKEENNHTVINFSRHRDAIFEIIKYLLKYPDPTPEDEMPGTASMTSGGPNNQQLVSDPFTMAINTVRGRAFQALMLFMYPDGRNSSNNKVEIKQETKDLYEDVLNKENTRALMFMFGHYLPSFYFRDIPWMQNLLPKIFSKDKEKKFLYLAAWEGYLANILYKEIFFDPYFQDLYEYALEVDVDDSSRRYFRDPDEGIATHFALAFVHYEEFGFDHPLFKAFWAKKDPELHGQFISFIGRSFVSGSNVEINEFLKKNPLAKKRIRKFWDWLLSNYQDPKPFTEFGSWISTNKDIFEPTWLAEHLNKTLIKSEGIIDWDYGITKSVVELSKIDPKSMASVAKLHFLEGQVKHPEKGFPFHVESEWIEALKILYNCKETRNEIYNLINDLIEKGGRSFWILKDILE